MPIYEYECGGCGRRYEALVRGAEEEVRCPGCGGAEKRKLFSVFASATKDAGAGAACDGCSASDACAAFAPSLRGCCGPGGCRH